MANGGVVQFELVRPLPHPPQKQEEAGQQRQDQRAQHQRRAKNGADANVCFGLARAPENCDDGKKRLGQRSRDAGQDAPDGAVGDAEPPAPPPDGVREDRGAAEDDPDRHKKEQQREEHGARQFRRRPRARSTSRTTSRSGRPVCSAIRLQSWYSGRAFRLRPPAFATLTRTGPNRVAPSASSRARGRRPTSCTRTPHVVVSAKRTLSTGSTLAGSANTLRTIPGRPRFMITGVSVTSRAPRASRRSISRSYPCGFLSSRFVSSMATRSDSAAAGGPPPKTP